MCKSVSSETKKNEPGNYKSFVIASNCADFTATIIIAWWKFNCIGIDVRPWLFSADQTIVSKHFEHAKAAWAIVSVQRLRWFPFLWIQAAGISICRMVADMRMLWIDCAVQIHFGTHGVVPWPSP